MVRHSLTAIALLGLSLGTACSGENASPEPQDSSAEAGASTEAADTPLADEGADPQADLSGAQSLIDRIYSSYSVEGGAERGDDIFTPELAAAVDRQSNDEGGGLGGDPFCQCQDFGKLGYEIQSLEPDNQGAVARVKVEPFGDGEGSVLTIQMARRGSTWLVADIVDDQSWSLLQGRQIT